MKIAVLADIHANLAALERVDCELSVLAPDVVVVAGDVVNRGPHPLECLQFVLEKEERHRWRVLKGNHETFVLRERDGPCERSEWETDLYRHTAWTCGKLKHYVDAMDRWGDAVEFTGPSGDLIRCVHASMRSNRHGLYRHMPDAELQELIAPAPAVLCVGHTHIPFIRTLGPTLVINVGAVGLPFDGDDRAGIAVVEWTARGWHAEIIRLPYERSRTERAYEESGYLEEGGVMVPLILDELRHARPRLGEWHRVYEHRVAAGELSIGESVQRLLAEPAAT
jgi:putative phosphoesterase